jgi:putative endopeptidase
MVNAQYILNKNEIHISTAYLQKPFIDIDDHGIEYNLAQVGFTIAHELCHALDDSGSKYDVNGNLKDWWGKQDKLKFKKIQQDIINHYITFAKFDGISYDPTYAVGEAIADISGLNLCEEYLRDYCLQNHFAPVIIYLYFRMFYVYFAYQMKQQIGKQTINYELVTNPHPIDKYRTNVTLSRSKLFKALYGVSKDDKMYWRDENSKIWE